MVVTGSLQPRLEAKIVRSNGCWGWTGSCDRNGYGRIGSGGKRGSILFAHRAAWAVYVGPIPLGFDVLHSCDNPPCCNPAHLFLGTQADNVADMRSKGRGKRPPLLSGERSRTAKLTWPMVEEIRQRHAREGTGHLAAEYGVSRSAIKRIVSGRTWRLVLKGEPS